MKSVLMGLTNWGNVIYLQCMRVIEATSNTLMTKDFKGLRPLPLFPGTQTMEPLLGRNGGGPSE